MILVQFSKMSDFDENPFFLDIFWEKLGYFWPNTSNGMESVAAVENEKTTSKTHVHPSKLPRQATRENVPKPSRQSRHRWSRKGGENPQLPGAATPPSIPEQSPAATSSPSQSEELLRTVPKVQKAL